MRWQSGGRSSEYVSTGVPIERAGRAVEGVLSMYGWGSIECMGRAVKGVLNMEVQEFL